jgi:fructose-1,6-bisphosphatase I
MSKRKDPPATSLSVNDDFNLTQHILYQSTHPSSLHKDHAQQLALLLDSIQQSCKWISAKVRAAGLFSLQGEAGLENATGDSVKKLDVLSNSAFIQGLTRSRTVAGMVSEEDEELIDVTDGPGKNGQFLLTFDPLDGSSNIDANVSIGTIFGVYKREANRMGKPVLKEEFMRPGTELVAAGYAMYGSATMLVLTIGSGVDGFTLDPTTGEFVLTHPSIKMPAYRSVYSVNEGNSVHWHEDVKEYVAACKAGPKPQSLRYVGSMVADVHRTFVCGGGSFMYPADKKSKNGKLRLLYEANPMALITEQAGGKAIAGHNQRILDLVPTSIHERTGVYLGSSKNIEDLEAIMAKHA